MSAPMERSGLSPKEGFCLIEATVVTGFEFVAKEEVEEVFGTECKELRGRVKFLCPIERVEKVLDLGCIDNCRVIVYYEPNFQFTDDKVENMRMLRNLVGNINWPSGLQIWKKFFTFEHPILEVPEVMPESFGEPHFPPPRQGTGTGRKTRKTKGKLRRLRKQQEKEAAKLAKMNRNGGDVEEKVDDGDDNADDGGVKEGPDGRLDGDGDDDEKCTDKTEGTKESVKTAKEETSESVGDKVGADNKMEESQAKLGDNNEPEGSLAKKPRVRENPWDTLMPSFRVTCLRNGERHNFDSMTAAANFGGAIYNYFKWNVKMTEFDIEVILGIEEHELTVSIGLTKESLHRRNITHFGPTTLRPTIAYSMLRLCEIQPGDVVCDPMCGTGSIPIQSALKWPLAYNICGEIGGNALIRTRNNLTDLAQMHKQQNKPAISVDPIRWDVCNLPLQDQSVDVFLADLPFGVRLGHKVENWRLYPGALLEMARVVRPESGRCCLLTEDKKCIIKSLMKMSKYWTRTKTLGINIGGLAAGVFVLSRTKLPFDSNENRKLFNPRGTKGDDFETKDNMDTE